MRHKGLKILLLLILAGIPVVLCIANPIYYPQSYNYIAKQLGWVPQKNAYNLCNGYYKELPIIYIPNPRVKSQADNYNIHADHVVIPLKQGPYVFKKNVVVTQIDRQLMSDFAYGYRDKQTGKLALIKTVGHVHLRAPNKLILAKQASFNIKNKKIILHDVHYRLNRGNTGIISVRNPKTGKIEKHIYQLSAHGSAQQVQHTNDKITILKNATYTTCQPDRCEIWLIKGSTIKLNSNKGRGEAWNTKLFVQGLPVFYFPYFSFPIDRKRHTGFLTPRFGASSHRGASVATPYYWNIAPNYDATITPNFMQKRGVLLQGLFRYLLPHSSGQIGGGYLPDDREFKKFKRKYPTAQGDNDRKNFFFKNATNFNQNLSATVDYNYVGDDYFIHDLGGSLINNSNNQLLRQMKVVYVNDIWNFLGNLQAYQTLHPVNQANVSNQYARLPQLQLNANFPEHPAGLYFGFNSELTRFDFTRNPYPDTTSIVGESVRSSLRPFVSLPLNWPFAYITPRAQLQLTSYHLQNPHFNFKKSPDLAVPIFDIRSGMYFDRDTKFLHHQYQQTLEPTVYYLYVPYHNQNNIPYFDTSTQSFNYDFMFLDNRFTGIDRIGDANRVTLGVTSRLIDQDSGYEKASASIGRIYYFHKRRVTLCYNPVCPVNANDQRYASPVAALATYHFNPYWSANAAATWNPVTRALDNRDVGLQYRLDNEHILNVDYNYQKQGDVIPGVPAGSSQNDLKQTNVAGYWKISKHWSIMGRWNYSWSQKYDQAFMYGLAYNSCCWAIRFVTGRTFVAVGPAPNYTRRYDHAYYIEVALKGLGTFANVDSTDFLSQSIAGYTDLFAQESRL